MMGRWNIGKAERCLVEVLRSEGLPGAYRLIEDALSLNFNSRVGDLKAVLHWINYAVSKSPLDPSHERAWVQKALYRGSPEVLQAMRIADGSLEPCGQLLSAVVLTRNTDMLAFFPGQQHWNPAVRRLITSFALKEVARSPQNKGSEPLLNSLLYPEMDVSQVTAEMLNSKPILRSIVKRGIRPPVSVLEGVTGRHRTELYKSGLFTADEAKVSQKMKRRALGNDLQL